MRRDVLNLAVLARETYRMRLTILSGRRRGQRPNRLAAEIEAEKGYSKLRLNYTL